MEFLKSFNTLTRAQIYCDRISTNAAKAFGLQSFHLEWDSTQADLLWIRDGFHKFFDALNPHQLINHFPNESAITNKGSLTQTLKRYEANHPEVGTLVGNIYPESYCLFEPEDRKAFFRQLPEEDTKDIIWIFKPGNQSRGRGIQIDWRTSKWRRQYEGLGDKYISIEDEKAIIQRYIKNPLLLDGRKSELRVYWLLASLDPLLVLLFNEGTVRLNAWPYQLDHFDHPLIHITNVYQQYGHPDFDPDTVLKWSFAQLDSYLYEDLKLADKRFTSEVLMPKINENLAHIVRASRDLFAHNYPKQGHCFGLYGADVILDDQLNPFISEIQGGPGLSFADPVKRRLIPPMLGEAARIMLEIREKRRKGKALLPLKSKKHFGWILNEAEGLAGASSTFLKTSDVGFDYTLVNATVRPCRRKEIEAFRVRDELVLHDTQRRQVFAINLSARAIWECCDGSYTLSEMSQVLGRRYDRPFEEMFADVKEAILDLHSRGLLILEPGESEREEVKPTAPPIIVDVAFDGHQVSVHTEAPEVGDWVARFFRAMRADAPTSIVGRLGVKQQGDTYRLTGTRELHVQNGSLDEALQRLRHEVVLQLIEARSDLVWLHAGAVAHRGKAVVVAGAWGCGKSTIVTTLYRRGWLYLSDDIVPFDPASERVLPFPQTPTVRKQQQEELPPGRVSELEKSWVDLDPKAVCPTPVPIQLIVFPIFQAGARLRLEPCSPGTAVVELVKQCLNVEQHRGSTFRHLCDLVGQIPAYFLLYDRGEQAAEQIIRFFETDSFG